MRKCSNQEKKLIFKHLEEKFGIDKKIFKGFELYMATRGRVFLGPKTIVKKLPIISLGFLILRFGHIKPTTNFFHMFGKHVKKNYLEVTREQAISYIRGEDLDLKEKNGLEGYVLVKYGQFPLGCGLVKEGKLKNMLPKAKRLNVKFLP